MDDFSIAPPGRVQLLFHQVAAEVDHVDLAAVVDQTARRFQTQQAAADDHRACVLCLACRDDAVAVVERAEGEDAVAQACRPAPSCPSIGGMKARLPVAMSS